VNFTTAAAKMLVIVERFPKIVYGFVARFGARVNKDTNFRLESYYD
jgi:hypothetical protein